MSTDQQDPWGADEVDELLAHPGSAGRLGQVLAAAGAPAEAVPLSGEEAVLAAFRTTFPVVGAPRSRILARMSGHAAAAALAGGLVLSGGAAAAAAGALPGAAQQTARDVLAKVGVSVPGPDERAGSHPGGRGKSTKAPATSVGQTVAPQGSDPSGTRSDVSGLARDTAATGVDKGAAVSGTASQGTSQAGQHGSATSPGAGTAEATTAKKAKKPKTLAPTPHATKRRNVDNPRPEKSGPAEAPPKGPPTPSPKATPAHPAGPAGEHP